MKNHKLLDNREYMQSLGYDIYKFLRKKYPEKEIYPFMDSRDIPNNWLKMHGYAMHRRRRRLKYENIFDL